MTKTSELSTSRSIVVCAIVLGCFAVLWPKIFYPMLFGNSNVRPAPTDDFQTERGPGFGHPALRDKEGPPRRTIEKELRPGPVPGMRPAMGGPGPGIQPQQKAPQQGTMGILMPLYTVGIVIFFVYTVMRLIFKKDEPSEMSKDETNYREYLNDTRAFNAAENRYNKQRREMQQTFTKQNGGTTKYSECQACKEEEEAAKKQSESAREDIPNKIEEEERADDNEDEEEGEKELSEAEEPEEEQMKEESEDEQVHSRIEVISPAEKETEKKLEKEIDPRDKEIAELKQRLMETESAMKLIMAQMKLDGGEEDT